MTIRDEIIEANARQQLINKLNEMTQNLTLDLADEQGVEPEQVAGLAKALVKAALNDVNEIF